MAALSFLGLVLSFSTLRKLVEGIDVDGIADKSTVYDNGFRIFFSKMGGFRIFMENPGFS